MGELMGCNEYIPALSIIGVDCSANALNSTSVLTVHWVSVGFHSMLWLWKLIQRLVITESQIHWLLNLIQFIFIFDKQLVIWLLFIFDLHLNWHKLSNTLLIDCLIVYTLEWQHLKQWVIYLQICSKDCLVRKRWEY